MKKLALLFGLFLACEKPLAPVHFGDNTTPGGQVDLQALVLSLGGTLPITWSVTPGGGSISASGVFTAPTCAVLLAALPPATDLRHAGQISGVDNVTASWTGGSVQLNVTTIEAVLGVEVAPPSGSVPPGGTLQLVATVHYTCHDQTTGP